MRSLYDDVLAALNAYDFSIPNVSIRKPYDESPKAYPSIVVHELNNVPKTHATMNGEDRTILSYQLDIQTQTSLDDTGAVLDRDTANRRLVGEANEAMESLNVTRRSVRENRGAVDVSERQWRGDAILDSYGYAYRP